MAKTAWGEESRLVRPGPRAGTVTTAKGDVIDVPPGWALLAPGDAVLTRRVKAAAPTWTVQMQRGRRTFSQGIWAPAERIEEARRALKRERATPEYAQKLAAGRKRRERAQEDYVAEFELHVRRFLDFEARHSALERRLARAVAKLATPVGSGTVARTARIPVEERAEAAVIAWLRHQTTAYDHMHIERVKGRRREVRRELARQSRAVLNRYRRGEDVGSECVLVAALGESVAPPNDREARLQAIRARAKSRG